MYIVFKSWFTEGKSRKLIGQYIGLICLISLDSKKHFFGVKIKNVLVIRKKNARMKLLDT